MVSSLMSYGYEIKEESEGNREDNSKIKFPRLRKKSLPSDTDTDKGNNHGYQVIKIPYQIFVETLNTFKHSFYIDYIRILGNIRKQ